MTAEQYKQLREAMMIDYSLPCHSIDNFYKTYIDEFESPSIASDEVPAPVLIISNQAPQELVEDNQFDAANMNPQ